MVRILQGRIILYFLDIHKFFYFGWYFRTFYITLSQADLSQ
jgi:hypothetical protein